MKKILFIAAAASLLVSCSENKEKKLLIIANKDAVIEEASKIITAGSDGYQNKTIEYKTGDAISLKIKSAQGETSIGIPDNGYYIVNVKLNDTIIGSYQRFVKAEEANHRMTQDELKAKLDSLKLLVENKNVSAANRNFFILPNTAVKISDNTTAQVAAPYNPLTPLESANSKEPEAYQFYTIKQVRELIAKLEMLTK